MVFVVIGSTLFAMGPVVEIIFALMVAASGFMMLKKHDDEEENKDFSSHLAYKTVRLFIPVFPRIVGHNFFLRKEEVEKELEKPENKTIVLKTFRSVVCNTAVFMPCCHRNHRRNVRF